MAEHTVADFANKVNELMPAIMREYIKHQGQEFYKLKITMPQFFVMDFLSHTGETKMTDLANYVNVTTAAMTGIVDRLVRDGYLARLKDPDDRRVVKVKLTAKGSGVVKDMVQRRKEITMRMFGEITQEEREAYLKILIHLNEHLKEGL